MRTPSRVPPTKRSAESIVTALRLPTDVHAAITRQAIAEGNTAASVIRRLLTTALRLSVAHQPDAELR